MQTETLYRCQNCGGFYLAPVTSCDCQVGVTPAYDTWIAMPAAPLPDDAVSVAQASAPAHIWLQHSDDDSGADETFPPDHEGITWASENIYKSDIPYVRADLVYRK